MIGNQQDDAETSSTKSSGSGLAGIVTAGFKPSGVLENHRLQLTGSRNDRIEFGCIAAHCNPKFHTHHRSVGNATLEFGERGIHVPGIEIHETKDPIRKLRNGLKNLVVFLGETFLAMDPGTTFSPI